MDIKNKILRRYLHQQVTVMLSEGETFTGCLVANEKERTGYFIIYEEDDSDRTHYFKSNQVVEIWITKNRKYKNVYKVGEKK